MSGFREAVEAVLDRGGLKGYNTALREVCRDLPHALGEIVYKVVRYHVKRDPQDLVKVAAWAKLEWDYANRTGSNSGDSAGAETAWTPDQGLISRIAHSRAGGAGGDSGSPWGGERAPSVFDQEFVNSQITGRTGAGNRRRRAVGKQSRHSGRKGAR